MYELLPEILGALLMLFIGWFSGYWRASLEWKRKVFRSKIHFSLNVIRYYKKNKPSLRVRTLFETSVDEVFGNQAIIDIVYKYARRTRAGDPLLRFTREDAWYVLNAILNQIAGIYAMGTFKHDMELKTTEKSYLFCLTFEKEGAVRAQKLRVMVMDKKKFLRFPEQGDIELEHSSHQMIGRIEILRFLRKEYAISPHLFKEITVYV